MAACDTVYLCLPKHAMLERALAGTSQSEPLSSLVSVSGMLLVSAVTVGVLAVGMLLRSDVYGSSVGTVALEMVGAVRCVQESGVHVPGIEKVGVKGPGVVKPCSD